MTEKTVNKSLFVLNLLIVAAAELSGSYFLESGIIHMIAVFFVGLAAYSIFRKYYLADPILKKFLNFSLLAFVVFSASHVIEFLSYQYSHNYSDSFYAVTLNFYVISFLILIAGSEFFLKVYMPFKHSKLTFALIGFTIIALALLSLVLIFNESFISLEPDSFAPYIYTISILFIMLVFWMRISLIATVLPRIAEFFNSLIWMAIFISISSTFYSFYEIIEHTAGIQEYQIIYISHFLFYIGMSLMFIAFQALSKVTGVLADLKRASTS